MKFTINNLQFTKCARRAKTRRAGIIAVFLALASSAAHGQTVSQRGFVEGRGFGFFEDAPNDTTRGIGDVLFREEAFYKPKPWFQFAGGLDLRGSSHDQVESQWRLDFSDRGLRRPHAAIRRLEATFTAGRFNLDVGKQFVRWARADILNPTDRFAPRDYLNVVDTDLLPILAVRPSIRLGGETVDVVWSPRFTPSRMPLLGQRWTVIPPDAANLLIVDGGSSIPHGSEEGIRWSHAGGRADFALSYFNGFNHLPDISVQDAGLSAVVLTRTYSALRTYGGDIVVPSSLVTLKGETAYFTSPGGIDNEFVLYVIEAERQIGEWQLDGGYIGEVVTRSNGPFRFAPDEGLARSIIARAAYTIDPRYTIAIEGAARQSGAGFYLKGELSRTVGQHWRLTFSGAGIAGNDTDFLGQFRRNSYASSTLRFSF